MPDTAEEATPAAEWNAVLAHLWQRSRDAVEGGHDAVTGPWSQPEVVSTMPTELVGYAEAVVRSQQRAIDALRARKSDVSARLRVMNTVPQAFRGDHPVYIDRLG